MAQKKSHNAVDSIMTLRKVCFKVGMTGLEPATTRPPDVYANQLRYIPLLCKSGAKVHTSGDICKFISHFFVRIAVYLQFLNISFCPLAAIGQTLAN